MEKLYMVSWYHRIEEERIEKLFSDLSEAENYYNELVTSERLLWAAVEELEEKDKSEGFKVGDCIHYNEF